MPASRICAQPGCPAFVTTGRCPRHQRPTAWRRGYDRDHRTQRARWAPRVATGTVLCRRCQQPIVPGEPWDLGHPDDECPAPRAPEHAARCNRAAAGRSAHRHGA